MISESPMILNTLILFFLISLGASVVFYMDFEGNNFYLDDDKKLPKFEKRLSIIPFVFTSVTILLFIIFFSTVGMFNFPKDITPLLIFLIAAFLAGISASVFPPIEILAIIFSLKHYKHNKNKKSKKYIIFSSISLIFSVLLIIWFCIALS